MIERNRILRKFAHALNYWHTRIEEADQIEFKLYFYACWLEVHKRMFEADENTPEACAARAPWVARVRELLTKPTPPRVGSLKEEIARASGNPPASAQKRVAPTKKRRRRK
jgi:hypothetical protein